jgi:hypothetical protein
MKVRDLQEALGRCNPNDDIVCVIEDDDNVEDFIKSYQVKGIKSINEFEKCRPRFKNLNAAIKKSEHPHNIVLMKITHDF